MKHSEQLDKIAPALAIAQANIKTAKKDSENPFFKSSYADLNSVWEAVKWALSENGLSVTQGYGVEPAPHIWTVLLHTSGQWIKGECPLVVGKPNDPQALGSATTYTRRYSLAAMLGVIQEDDDANSAQARPEGTKTGGGPTAKKASVAALNEIKSYLDSGLVKMPDWWETKRKIYKVSKAQDLDEGQALALLNELHSIEDKANGKA